ncbi:transcription initiation at TATA-containing promoter protein, partial [Perkinsus olseni]
MLLNYEMPGRDFLEQWCYVQRWIGLEEAAVHPGLPHHAMQRRAPAYRLRFPGEGPESRINIVTTGPEANGGDELTVEASHMMTRPTGVAAVLQAKNVEGASKEKSRMERNWSEALAACFTWAPEDRITPAQMLSSPFITEANEVDESGKFWREKTDTEVLEMFYGEKDGFLRKAAERMVEKDVVVETFEDFKNYLEEVGYRWTKEFRRLRKAMPEHGQLPPSYPGLDFGPLTGVDEDMESDLSISTEDCSTSNINTVTAGLPMPSPFSASFRPPFVVHLMTWRDECKKVRARVEKADRGYFFVKPVIECELPDEVKRRYRLAISSPMDLRTVGERL